MLSVVSDVVVIDSLVAYNTHCCSHHVLSLMLLNVCDCTIIMPFFQRETKVINSNIH